MATSADKPQQPAEPPSQLPPPTVGGESVLASEAPLAAELPRDEVVVGSAEPAAIGLGGPDVPISGVTGPGGNRRLGDKIFTSLTTGAAGFVVVLVLLVAAFLLIKSIPSIVDDKSNFLTSTDWSPTPGDLHFGIASLLWTTVIVSLVALVIAVPIAIGIALFITQYAPKRFARPIAYVIDLLAAIPSIIYGIWGARVLSPRLEGVQRTLYHLGGFPLFKDRNIITGSVFNAGIVLAIMILPIITAISRDVFERTPRHNVEAAWALGATRWEMIRMAVLPYGRAGVVSGSMLGLGRALGETIAVALILSKVSQGQFSFSIFSGGETIASKIANNAQEFNNPASTGAYIAAGLALFALTFVVNAAARAIVNRKKDFS